MTQNEVAGHFLECYCLKISGPWSNIYIYIYIYIISINSLCLTNIKPFESWKVWNYFYAQCPPTPPHQLNAHWIVATFTAFACLSLKSTYDLKMGMEQWWNDNDRRKPKYSYKNSSHCHCVHQKSHVNSPRMNPERSRWTASDERPDPRKGPEAWS